MQVIIYMYGGAIQNVVADEPVEVFLNDEDTDKPGDMVGNDNLLHIHVNANWIRQHTSLARSSSFLSLV